ncbi:RNA-directed DNA polymerase from transposon BS, partial [Paramuricea clavata]
MPAVETRNRYSVLSDVVAKPSESDASSSEFIEPEKSKTASGMSGQRVNGKNRKSRTTVIISDSMTKHIDVQRLERSVRGSKVRLETYSGANVEAISHHVQPCLKKKPDDLIIHVGTNDLKAKSSSDVANEIINLCTGISETHPSTRTDQIDLVPKIRE